jgi:hypothetical protein
MAGWTIGAVEVKDEDVSTKTTTFPSGGIGKQTGAAIFLTNSSIAKDGGFLLQPIVQAFSDLRRIEILYFVQKQPNFIGLRSFDSRSLAVNMVKDGGPYRYEVDIKEQGVPLPNLPLIQPAVAVSPSSTATEGASAHVNSTADYAFVLLVAASCSLVVLAALLLLGRYRAAQINERNSRRAHRL